MRISSVHTLADAFKMAGFEVEPMDDYVGYFVKGQNVKGRFCEQGKGDGYSMHDGRIALDHIKCYDKPQKCPLVMKLPLEFNNLLGYIKFLGSKAGYKWSNSYDYLTNVTLPREV